MATQLWNYRRKSKIGTCKRVKKIISVSDPSEVLKALSGYITGYYKPQLMYAEKNYHITFTQETYEKMLELNNEMAIENSQS